MKLDNILTITGTIEVLTGLHIGSGNNEMHIGGSDNPIIRHPHTKQPYIPGSSLKGKIRSLLEWRAGLAAVNGGKPMSYAKLGDAPDKEEARKILKLFGVSGGDELDEKQAREIGPTRLSFRDCLPDEGWAKEVDDKNLPLTEIKMENTINRVTGTAEHPRNVERVPAGARFDFAVALKILDTDKADELKETLFNGLKLLEMDSLGGSGSRGYGRVRFTLTSEGHQGKLNEAKPFASK
ncbi:MAG: type III-A CRISPR-associated RAMP protein Csm3 [Magnetococcales bacterium]|nr:type III-A CRISPR-associated RAMP protein Csm3 [Magnetococcales bacterium]MBF0321535.1 type III-A CRISPR-associated RAMP protein Csm3 [Magnetococcales bacterium]MBF0321539.1 type III-A CRISPR-associated RAMP protein Csm3 [Magnetococcales bacterium]